MKFHFNILVIIYYTLITVDGRNLNEYERNIGTNDDNGLERLQNRPERHNRNRRQSYLTHNRQIDYLKVISYSMRDMATSLSQLTSYNQNNVLYDDRGDETCHCEELIRKLTTLVEELTKQAKYTPPPPKPQVIYVPYPVYKNPSVNITDRIKVDRNRIWPDIPKETDYSDEGGDGSRPVSFKPILPKRPTVQPPSFDHGSKQEGITTTTSAPLKKPSICEGAILSCCGLQDDEKEECFSSYSCSRTYESGKACLPQVVQMVLEKFSKIYGPTNEY